MRALAGVKAVESALELWMEPGRFFVAAAGVLLARVTQTKGKGEKRYVGVATGMNSLIRPALYGACHEIVNLTRLDEPAIQTCTVVGPICESGDELGRDRRLPRCEEGDVLLVAMQARTVTRWLRTTTCGPGARARDAGMTEVHRVAPLAAHCDQCDLGISTSWRSS